MNGFYGGNLELLIELESIFLIFGENITANTLVYVENLWLGSLRKRNKRITTYYSQSFEYISIRHIFFPVLEESKFIYVKKTKSLSKNKLV